MEAAGCEMAFCELHGRLEYIAPRLRNVSRLPADPLAQTSEEQFTAHAKRTKVDPLSGLVPDTNAYPS
jgi:hypothetical protein